MTRIRLCLSLILAGVCVGCPAGLPTAVVLDDQGAPIIAGTDITADGPMKLDVHGLDRTFAVLLAPQPNVNESAEAMVSNVAPFLSISIGWAYLAGERPVVRSKRVSAASEGTHFIIQIDGDIERVFLRSIKGDEKITVEYFSDKGDALDKRQWTATEDLYVETDPVNGVLVGPMPIPTKAGDPVGDFYAAAIQIAADAGLGP